MQVFVPGFGLVLGGKPCMRPEAAHGSFVVPPGTVPTQTPKAHPKHDAIASREIPAELEGRPDEL